MNLKNVDDEIKNCPETIFDTFDLSIDSGLVGHGLREKLVELSNIYGRINQLATNAYFMYEKAKNRVDKVTSEAWSNVDSSLKISDKKILIKTMMVTVDDEKTTLGEEIDKMNIYNYIYTRGKDKVKEISALLDVGRTLLSWDKSEQSRTQYD